MTDLRDNLSESRYEMEEDGQIVFADYRKAGKELVIDWVEAPLSLRGTGASGRLMKLVAEEARAKGWKIVPICGYAAGWLRRSREHRDLLA
ncbi:MAG: GNAT family N-acetyltransferase [Alphaproteobacteria bacterium]|nr:GNAT family N-acetyltransferase [Alphaproteobacteria bacterium]